MTTIEQLIPTIPTTTTALCWPVKFEGQKELPETTKRKFQNAMRKQFGFYLNEPYMCCWGAKDGNWAAEDSTGQTWQIDNAGSDYDTVAYITGNVRSAVWQDIAHSKGFHLSDA